QRLNDLKHCAVAARAARRGCTEQVARGVGDQAAGWKRAVRSVKADQRGRCAGVSTGGLGDLEHRAVVVRAAVYGCAEQVACGVGDQAAEWNRAVRSIK